METLFQDLRYGARMLVRNPGFTASAVLVLGLGVGANTAIFSLINGAFMRPPVVAAPDRLLWVTVKSPERSRQFNLSYPDYLDYRDRSGVFSGLIAYDDLPLALSGQGQPERIKGHIVTGNYFPVLGVEPLVGRFLSAEEDRAPGADPVAVLSYALWKRRFGSDPSVVGKTVILNSHPFTVIGVAPEGFSGTELDVSPEIWIPMAMHAQARPGAPGLVDERDASWLRVMGRLEPGVTKEQAGAAMNVIARQIAQAHPGFHTGMSVVLTRLSGAIPPTSRGEAVSILALLLGVTGFVLLIACANVANLLLARAASRRREIGIRLALGATRGRLVRQLLAESLLVAILGGAAGLLLSAWASDLVLALTVGDVPPALLRVMRPDARVLGFTLALAVLTGMLSGLAPALHACGPDVAPALRDEALAVGRGRRRSRLQSLLVVAQVALSIVLLVGAGLFLRSLRKAAAVDPGFDVRNALAVSFDLQLQGYSGERTLTFCRELTERVGALPGVRSVTFAALVPLSGRMIGMGITLDGDAPSDGRQETTVHLNAVWPSYFSTLGIPLVRGRDFTLSDREGAPGVVIVNETAARRFWPGEEPLGKRLSPSGPEGPYLEVIGVASDSKYDELNEATEPFLYLPHLQNLDLLSETTLLARTEDDPSRMLRAVQHALRSMDPTLPLFDATTLSASVERRNDKNGGVAKLLSLFGALALLLASMGLYGVMAYSVTQRTREIGIRLAIGARPEAILRMIVGEGVRLGLAGVAVGLALSAGLTRVLSSMLFGVTPTDLATFAGVSLLLAGVAAAATYLPARRAARVDPMAALRAE